MKVVMRVSSYIKRDDLTLRHSHDRKVCGDDCVFVCRCEWSSTNAVFFLFLLLLLFLHYLACSSGVTAHLLLFFPDHFLHKQRQYAH